MKHILGILATFATIGIVSTGPGVADPPPGYFYLHNAAFNVTSEGTAIKVVGANGIPSCEVDYTTRIGNGSIADFNFAAVVSLGENCAPTLTIENVTGKVLTHNSLWQDVRAAQLDPIDIEMTWSKQFMRWYAVELSAPVYVIDTSVDRGHAPTGWRNPSIAYSIPDPGCQAWEGECHHVWSRMEAEFYYNAGIFGPLCATNCHHWKVANAEAYFMSPIPWCETYGEVPFFSKEKCSAQTTWS